LRFPYFLQNIRNLSNYFDCFSDRFFFSPAYDFRFFLLFFLPFFSSL